MSAEVVDAVMLFDPQMPFTRAQALVAGLTDQDLRGPRFRRLFRGVHISSSRHRSPEVMAHAALLVVGSPDAHVSHATAARVYGLPIPTLPDEHVIVPAPHTRRSRQGLITHVGPPGATCDYRGIRISSPERTFAELAATLNLVDLVVVGDHLVRKGLTTIDGLRHVLRTCPLPHAALARTALDYVRERVDSPLETQTRMLIVLAGLPEPEVNVEIRSGNGRLLRKHDLVLVARRLVIEVNGRTHIDNQRSWEHDITRREESDADGWRTIVVIGPDIHRRSSRTVARLHRAMREAGVAGLPARPREVWRPYFPE